MVLAREQVIPKKRMLKTVRSNDSAIGRPLARTCHELVREA